MVKKIVMEDAEQIRRKVKAESIKARLDGKSIHGLSPEELTMVVEYLAMQHDLVDDTGKVHLP